MPKASSGNRLTKSIRMSAFRPSSNTFQRTWPVGHRRYHWQDFAPIRHPDFRGLAGRHMGTAPNAVGAQPGLVAPVNPGAFRLGPLRDLGIRVVQPGPPPGAVHDRCRCLVPREVLIAATESPVAILWCDPPRCRVWHDPDLLRCPYTTGDRFASVSIALGQLRMNNDEMYLSIGEDRQEARAACAGSGRQHVFGAKHAG